MLDGGIGLALDDLLNLKIRCRQVACHLVGLEKEKVHADRVSPPLVEVNGILSDVETQ
jgi:hypothetical protein